MWLKGRTGSFLSLRRWFRFPVAVKRQPRQIALLHSDLTRLKIHLLYFQSCIIQSLDRLPAARLYCHWMFSRHLVFSRDSSESWVRLCSPCCPYIFFCSWIYPPFKIGNLWCIYVQFWKTTFRNNAREQKYNHLVFQRGKLGLVIKVEKGSTPSKHSMSVQLHILLRYHCWRFFSQRPSSEHEQC